MGFFDEIGSKITGGVSAATNKTKELAEVSRLNSKISANNTAVKTKYEEAGRIVKAELAQGISHEKLLEIFAEIDQLDAETAEMKKQVQQIKGIRICTSCGAEIPAESLFCASCGTKVAQPAPAATAPAEPVAPAPAPVQTPAPAAPAAEPTATAASPVICPNCGNHEEDGVRFCSNCGTKLEAPSQKLVCSKCGNTEEPGTRFCSECGNRLDAVQHA